MTIAKQLIDAVVDGKPIGNLLEDDLSVEDAAYSDDLSTMDSADLVDLVSSEDMSSEFGKKILAELLKRLEPTLKRRPVGRPPKRKPLGLYNTDID